MSFRTIIIKSRVKLELSLGYLVCRGEVEKKVHLGEISTIIIQTTAASITTGLLSKLIEKNIKIIFCDARCNPQSELIPYYSNHNPYLKIMEQVDWNNEIKSKVWMQIVEKKIINQALVLQKWKKEKESKMLLKYGNEIMENDSSNREGHAAKVYFNGLFGNEFSRGSDDKINSFLNYGYSILLSSVNRVIAEHGYYTQIGIHHKNEYNFFNFSCDLMEPFRPIMDDYILSKDLTMENFKKIIPDFLNTYVYVSNKKFFMENGIREYARSVFNYLNKGDASIKFPEKYEF